MMSTMTTIVATTHTNQIKKPKASASERSGLGGMSRGFMSRTGDGPCGAGDPTAAACAATPAQIT